ncbi:transglycosylase SLT domain-containing protein [Megasphaera elsdenii]|uniref:transglycosylase SLT domain-containing protein n=1 Tax=Megasphaera elsdenii TaxID=907 RepID=UPI001D006A77|nr:transglycosylase SLT domain-containing protein [Megasphaera elsdenii]MCB5701432.1 transglycosylase SLT domain-containing protein [Megasphaera elsdenii]MCB5726191.1 transglycosylase SLT domain-containing protein [Megasphaera elsdenii]MCB5770086.1 transglycosylase SLT domain-containing protein [Megasphaera elsdenii]
MATLADLMIKIGADSTGLSRELNKSKEALNQTFSVSPVKEFSGSVDEVAGKISGLTGNLTKLASIAAGGFGLNAVVQSAVNAGEAVYQLGQRYSMSAAQAGQLNAVMKLTGGDVDTAAAAIMRFDKTLSSSGTAGDKARSIMQQLGISMTDSSGRLKPLNEQLGALAKGYEKAKAAGQGQEFLMNTLGVRGLALTKTLDNYTEAAERASKIKGVGLNPAEMHKAYMDMQEVNMQFGKLGVVAGSALAPLVSQILPSVQVGLAKVATLIAQNKTAISTVIVEGTKLLAIYKSLQMASKAVTAGKNMYNTARNVLGAGQKNSSTAQEEKQLDQLTKKQERYIQKSIADSDRMYQKRRKEAIKTAEQENMSAEETQKFLAEKFTQIGEEAATAAEQIRSRMTAAYQQINLAAQEAATGVQEANIRMTESNAQVAESEAATGTAAEEAAVVKQEANAAKITSNEEVIVANGEVADSEVATGTAAEEGAVAKQEANAAKVASTEEVIAANEREKVAEVATGVEATNAGTKSVAANTAAQGGLAKTESKTKDVAKGHVMAGNAAMQTGAKTVKAAGQGLGAIGKVTSALSMMAGGWMGVAAAALYAAYCAFKYFNAKYEAAKKNTWTGDDGYQVTVRNGQFFKQVPNEGDSDIAADPTGQGEIANGGVNEVLIEPGTPEYAKNWDKWVDKGGGADYMKEQAEKAMADANAAAGNVDYDMPSFDFSGDDGGGGGGGGSSSGGASSAAAEKAATPMKTVYSFENDGELAPYANEIKYAGSYWGVPPELIAAIIKTESHGVADAWSSDGAHYGLGQISQDIANRYAGGQGYGAGSDYNQNIMAVGGYLAALYQQYGDLNQTISAYNAGHATDSNIGYVNSVLSYMNAMTSKQVPDTGSTAAAQPVEYDVPVGELAAYHAINDYWDGQKWRGKLGNDNDGWCDDFVHQIYKDVFDQLGKADPFGDGFVNDASFKALGAYHAGDLEAVRSALQVGDLIDTPGHVGIYIGNGMVRSRQSSAGVHDLSLDEFSNTFGGIQGYGSLAEATGGMTVKSSLVGKTAVNQAAAEAAKRLEKAKQDYAAILNELRGDVETQTGTDYEKGMLGLMKSYAQKYQKIRAVENVGGVDTSEAKKLLEEYKLEQIKQLNEKRLQAEQQLRDDTAKVNAQMKGDYTVLYDAELKKNLDALQKEKEARFKSVATHKNDVEAMAEVNEWYTARYLELTKKREEERRQEFDNSVKDAISDLDVSRLSKLVYSKQGLDDIKWDEKSKAMQLFYSQWRAASISTYGIAEEAASSISSGLSSVFSDLGNNISNVGKLAQNMGKVILDTIVKIAAQWAAAKITMGLLGGFLGIAQPTAGAFGAGWNYASGYGSWYSGAGLPSFSVPAFANGGRVTAPTLAMLGEGKEEEGVFPLNDDTYARMAQGIVNARGNNNGGSAPVVNIINNSSSQVSVKDSHYESSMRRWILNAVVEDVNNNVDGSAMNLKAALGVR